MSEKNSSTTREKFDKRYSGAEALVLGLMSMVLYLLIAVHIYPTPEYSMFPEGYGLFWFAFLVLVAESAFLIRYLRESISVKGISNTVYSVASTTTILQKSVLLGIFVLLVYWSSIDPLGSVELELILAILLIQNLRRTFSKIAVSEIEVKDRGTTENDWALSAEDISNMSDSDWNETE